MIVALILGAIVIAGILYSAACTMQGLALTNERLATFVPDLSTTTRRFGQPPSTVWAAYEQAVRKTPGMSLRETGADSMLVDLRPTTRILGGNFGLAIRLRFADTGGGTEVRADAKNKVSMAVANHEAALRQAERALRMNAKKLHQLHELIGEPTR
jgi:hypothetical protein